MRIAYFDCFSGASGDMILGACLDAGLDIEFLRQELAKLPVAGYTVDAQKIRKQGFSATQFDVHIDPQVDKPHRHLKHIKEIITGSELDADVQQRALDIFQRLAEVEAQAHGTTIEKVHFHEVGAVDAIVDIVGACVALAHFGIEKVYASAIPVGSGTVKCEHGIMPVPAPATAGLLKGVPLAETDEVGELTTPTGAAILTSLTKSFGPMPAMKLDVIGIGAGRRDGRHRPNVLRLMIGESVSSACADGDSDEADQIVVMETNLDDVSPEVVGHVQDRLLQAGALDVYHTPVFMKKGRPASVLTVLAKPEDRPAFETIIFQEAATFGIRYSQLNRTKLSRRSEQVETSFGAVSVKVGMRAGQVVAVSPEYEDCRTLAAKTNQPIAVIMEAARQAWYAEDRK